MVNRALLKRGRAGRRGDRAEDAAARTGACRPRAGSRAASPRACVRRVISGIHSPWSVSTSPHGLYRTDRAGARTDVERSVSETRGRARGSSACLGHSTGAKGGTLDARAPGITRDDARRLQPTGRRGRRRGDAASGRGGEDAALVRLLDLETVVLGDLLAQPSAFGLVVRLQLAPEGDHGRPADRQQNDAEGQGDADGRRLQGVSPPAMSRAKAITDVARVKNTRVQREAPPRRPWRSCSSRGRRSRRR